MLVLAVAALAQTASEMPGDDVRRVGARLQCQCGCKDSVATCSMLECHFSKPAKLRIAQMQSVGMTDRQIIDAFMREYGPAIYLAPPNAFGWIIPYLAAALGLGAIFLYLRTAYKKPAPVATSGVVADDDPELARYKEQIEKDTAHLE
jgi:cytochrome c-type biogenesis protein CcmH/NrfF